MEKKIPLYFNYIENTFPKLLDNAVNSIKHNRLEVKVIRHVKPKPFTQCLNAIQKECLERNEKCWMFMHCDAEILDNSIIDMILKRYENPQNGEKIASVCACAITDLLILYDTNLIQELNGWDEKNFNNSYMEIDLHNRIISRGFTQPILYKSDCPKQMSHKESSSLRNKNKKGSLFKVYSKSYEQDMRNFYKIYHPNLNVNINPGLVRWKKYVGKKEGEFEKRDLNIVFSAGKTASTSLFRSWVHQENALPIAHTHCLEWFTVVDFENSVFMKNMFTNMKQTICHIEKPEYVPNGCVEIKFNLRGGVKFGNAFPNLLFDEINIVSIVRHPVNRRISQFLNTLTCDSLNTAITVSEKKGFRKLDPSMDILTQLKNYRNLFDKPTSCVIRKLLTNVAYRENRLYNKSDLIPLFKKMFTGTGHQEYSWLFNKMKNMLNINIIPGEIAEKGFTIKRGNIDYSKIDSSQKDSNNVRVNCIIVKMEKLYDPTIRNIVKEFTGIREIRHDRNILEEIPTVDADLNDLKNSLRNSFDTKSIYGDEESSEFKLVKALGY